VDAASLLPADDSSYGFDNIADVLSISPGLHDRYLSAARRISRLAVGDATLPVTVSVERSSPGLLQNDRMSDDLPFGSQGGLAFRHYLPADGEYAIAIRFFGSPRGTIDIRLDNARIAVLDAAAPKVSAAPGTPEPPRE